MLDFLLDVGLFIVFWLGPLLVAALHVFIFCRSARRLSMRQEFIVGTLAIVAAILGAVFAALAGYLAQGAAAVAALLILAFVMARHTAKLAELAIGESYLSQTFGSFPASPGSKYETLPMLELALGIGSILLAQVTPMAKILELWAYLPVGLWVGLGAVFQIYHLRAHAAQRTAAPSGQL